MWSSVVSVMRYLGACHGGRGRLRSTGDWDTGSTVTMRDMRQVCGHMVPGNQSDDRVLSTDNIEIARRGERGCGPEARVFSSLTFTGRDHWLRLQLGFMQLWIRSRHLDLGLAALALSCVCDLETIVILVRHCEGYRPLHHRAVRDWPGSPGS